MTLVLRFRDLVTSPGDTIRFHKEIIDTRGFVYWGWWAKAGERCPSIFLEYQNALDNSSQEVLLFDSGQSKLYSAQLVQLNFENSPSGIQCPESDGYTPEYYRQRAFKAWFKFSSIEEIAEEELTATLGRYSYDDNNYGLFSENEQFKDFFHKKVYSLEELRHQDRTLWFLTAFQDGHSEHEILLYNSNTLVPAVFPSNYIKVSGSKIHWLSDLHFSEGRNQHGFDDYHQVNSLYEIIENRFKEELNALIVSGDMTWRASSNEFEKTVKFYKDLSSNTKLDFSKICFCPGNHDLSYTGELNAAQRDALEKLHLLQRGEKITENSEEDTQSSRTRLNPEEIESLRLLETSLISKEAYECHFKTVTSSKPNEYLSMGKKFLINNQRPVEVCLFNSNRMQQYKDLYQGNGFVGQDQRLDAAKKMEWGSPKAYGALRIVVLHHNLLPVEYSNVPYLGASPGSYVYDSQATLQWCYDHDVDVILHGHTHQKSVVKLCDATTDQSKSVWLVGLGSTGAHSSHIVPGQLNQLAELDFSNKDIKIQFFDISNGNVSVSGAPLILE